MKRALAIATALMLTCGVVRAESDTAKKAETAEALALALLLQQAEAAIALTSGLDTSRQDVAVSIASVDALLAHSPTLPANMSTYWTAVQQLDRAGLVALASTYQARAAAQATATIGTDIWSTAALSCANGLMARLK
ncbi:hypothetical protein DBB29_08630 [Pandoraea cepalis]|uniref:Uncharacterized protein n=1 Tax=Pandoraea cepalis TaxID=2508294 RepID=A0AAW7MM13_9BURK|nr:hypothetical protein [Pandoraea cepalis]MDN4573638.1 hypothetical protein [Pandoraea cepalis]MDN4578180.1 hypothetical protein [Pandoraea cepalis]